MNSIWSANAGCLVGGLITFSAPGSELSSAFGAPLSAVTIDAFEGQITKDPRCSVSITVTTDNSTTRCLAEMSIRGSSSAKREKKPYRLELQDENGDDLKLTLLGMPKESDWILYPVHTDKTMIRDVLAYELWRQMGYWAPCTRYVHLSIFTNSSSLPSRRSVEKNSASASSVLSPSGPSLPLRPSVENPSAPNAFASIRVISGQSPSLPSVKPNVKR